MKTPSLTQRFAVWFVLVSLLPILLVGYGMMSSFEAEMRKAALKHVSAIADTKLDDIDIYLGERLRDAAVLAQDDTTLRATREFSKAFAEGGGKSKAYALLEAQYRRHFKQFAEVSGYYDVLLISQQGVVVYTNAHEADFTSNLLSGPYKDTGLGRITRQALSSLQSSLSDFDHYAPSGGQISAFIAAPIVADGKIVGVVALQFNNARVWDVLTDNIGLGGSGETVVVRWEDERNALVMAPLKSDPDATLKRRIPFSITATRLGLSGQRGTGIVVDYRGVPVVAAWRYLPLMGWGMIVKTDVSEALAPVFRMRIIALVVAGLTLLIIMLGAFLLGRGIVNPLRKLSRAAEGLAAGNLDQRVVVEREDEVGQLGQSFNVMADEISALVARQRQAQQALRESNENLEQRVEERTAALSRTANVLHEAQRLARMGSWDLDLVSGYLNWSDEIYHLFEIDKAVFGASYEAFLSAIHPDDREAVNLAYTSSVSSRRPYQFTHRLQMPDGRIKWVEERCQTDYGDDGKPIHSSGTVQDITESINFTQALRESEKRLKEAQRIAQVGSWNSDLVSGARFWSDETYNILELDKALFGASDEVFFAAIHPDDRESLELAYAKSISDRMPYQITLRLQMPDGRIKWVEVHCQTEYGGDGKPLHSSGTVQDISESKRIELAMAALSVDLIELEGAVYYEAAVKQLAALLGAEIAFITRLDLTKPGELSTISWFKDGRVLPNVNIDTAGTPLARVIEGHSFYVESGVQKQYPTARFLAENRIEGYAAEPLIDHAGQVLGHISVMSIRPLPNKATTLTTLRMFSVAIVAEIVRERHQRQYEDLFEFSPSGMVMADQQGLITLVNREAEQMFGYTRAEMLGQPIEMLVAPALREGHKHLRGNFHKNAKRHRMGANRPSLRGHRKDGSDFPAEIDLAPVQSENGIMVAAAVRDITARRLLEAKLAEAMKMDAIGKLTGGMAHDFNNYLGVIIGNLDLLKELEGNDLAAVKLIDGALGGALRGADLTQSLLAFSRRQPLDSKITDLNQNIEGIANLLQRTVGKNVTLSLKLEPEIWLVKIDGAQLDSCIINLANNASFAMPQGGSLVLLTRNTTLDPSYAEANMEAAPGDYVLIEVSDTGSGMPPEIVASAFEPFFTTKGPGHGTGLGLSMVYGFVKQSGGHIKIYSEVGHGTTIRLYLPRAIAEGARADDISPVAPAAVTGGTEAILVVEDNELVRRTVMKQLVSLGYMAIEAENGEAALAILEQSDQAIDLLFTDVVMPGKLDGFELAKMALAGRPGIKILLTSGFPGDTLKNIGNLAASMGMLGKPYRKNDLAQEIRRMLDSANQV